jgi:hypothetical protein
MCYSNAASPVVLITRCLPSRNQLHCAAMKSKLNSLHIRVWENSGQAVVIEDFYMQVNARRYDL